MIPNILIPHVKNFQFYPDQEKVSGRMYGGRAIAELNGHTFSFQLWHHGGDTETADTLKQHLTLQHIDGLDAHWHVLWQHDAIWLHDAGWFDDEKLRYLVGNRDNPNFYPYQGLNSDELSALGFVRIV